MGNLEKMTHNVVGETKMQIKEDDMDLLLFIRSNFKRGLLLAAGLFITSGFVGYGVSLTSGFMAFWCGCGSLVLAVAALLVLFFLINPDDL